MFSEGFKHFCPSKFMETEIKIAAVLLAPLRKKSIRISDNNGRTHAHYSYIHIIFT